MFKRLYQYFQPKTLDEKREIVKLAVRERKVTTKYPALAYMEEALYRGWEDVASSFLSEHIRLKAAEML